MNRTIQNGILSIFLFTVTLAGADTFKHRSTGHTFDGFRTHRKSGDKTLVFNEKENKYIPLNLLCLIQFILSDQFGLTSGPIPRLVLPSQKEAFVFPPLHLHRKPRMA